MLGFRFSQRAAEDFGLHKVYFSYSNPSTSTTVP